jgi:hypothetical protein
MREEEWREGGMEREIRLGQIYRGESAGGVMSRDGGLTASLDFTEEQTRVGNGNY